jgi:hypothetical protein
MERHLEHMVVRLHDLCPQLPGVLCDWVMWLLNVAPESRPASAQVALDALCVLSGTTLDPVADSVLMPEEKPATTTPETASGRGMGMFLIFGGVVVALLILGWFLFLSEAAFAMPFHEVVKAASQEIRN